MTIVLPRNRHRSRKKAIPRGERKSTKERDAGTRSEKEECADQSSEAEKARKLLKAAAIELTEDEENPGYYRANFQFVPHFQMEGMDISLSMTSQLRQAGG